MPDGRALFVGLTAPGDRVRVRVLESRKRFARGEVDAILDPSPRRVEPACPVFGRCGGCAWQHLGYEDQLAAKATILRDALARIGHLDVPEPVTIVPSPSSYGYRNRARLVQDPASGAIGYRMRRSHRVCAVSKCPILEPALEAALARLAGRAEPFEGEPIEWEITAGSSGDVQIVRSAGAGDAPGGVELRVVGDSMRVSNGVFAQANRHLLDALAGAVFRRVGSGTTLLELFAGAGFFTMELARRFDLVWAVESNPKATLDLRHNLTISRADNVEIHTGVVEKVLPKLRARVLDAVLLDPPRSGLPKAAMQPLLDLEPKRIVYLSCDPATLARDARILNEKGYRLKTAEAFDLFPQTPHVESLISLERD